jgi:hypothetical protein
MCDNDETRFRLDREIVGFNVIEPLHLQAYVEWT